MPNADRRGARRGPHRRPSTAWYRSWPRPSIPDGSLDLPSLRRLTEFQLASGVHGVAVLGMASEAFALTAAERRLITTTVAEVVAGAVPLVVGVAATSTVTAVEQAREAAAAGADAVMVLPPFMVAPSPAQLPEFYAAVAAAGPEVMVQDAPGVTGVAMSPQQLVELGRLHRSHLGEGRGSTDRAEGRSCGGPDRRARLRRTGWAERAVPARRTRGRGGRLDARLRDPRPASHRSHRLASRPVRRCPGEVRPLLPLLVYGLQTGHRLGRPQGSPGTSRPDRPRHGPGPGARPRQQSAGRSDCDTRPAGPYCRPLR